MLQELLLRGELLHGEIISYSAMAERSGRKLLGQLLKEGLIISDSRKWCVRMACTRHLEGYLLPGLLA